MLKIISLLGLGLITSEIARALPLDAPLIETLTGAQGTADPQTQSFLISVPHDNYTVDTGGVRLSSSLGLTSWARFKDEGEKTTVEGEFVIFEPQVNFIIQEALDQGLTVTSLQHRSLYSKPPVLYLTFRGQGTTQELAKGIGKVYDTMKKTTFHKPWNVPRLSSTFENRSPNMRAIESILKIEGKKEEKVLKVELDPLVSIPMPQKSQVAFTGSDKVTVMVGAFIMDEDRADQILKSLLDRHILITAIHPFPNTTRLPLLEVHFLGQGTAEDLAGYLQEIRDPQSKPSAF